MRRIGNRVKPMFVIVAESIEPSTILTVAVAVVPTPTPMSKGAVNLTSSAHQSNQNQH